MSNQVDDFPIQTVPPSDPMIGMIYINSDNSYWYIYSGIESGWSKIYHHATTITGRNPEGGFIPRPQQRPFPLKELFKKQIKKKEDKPKPKRKRELMLL